MTERPPRRNNATHAEGEAVRDALRRKVHHHRARLKAKGLKPVQIWLPDVKAASFRAAARKQARAIAASTAEAGDIGFVEAIADWAG